MDIHPIGLGKLIAALNKSIQVTEAQRIKPLDSHVASTRAMSTRPSGIAGDPPVALSSDRELITILQLPETKSSYDYIRPLMNIEPPLTVDEADSLRSVITSLLIPSDRLPDAVALVRMGLPVSKTTWQLFQSIWHGPTWGDRLNQWVIELQSQASTETARRNGPEDEGNAVAGSLAGVPVASKSTVERLLAMVGALKNLPLTPTVDSVEHALVQAGSMNHINQEMEIWAGRSQSAAEEYVIPTEKLTPEADVRVLDLKASLLHHRLGDGSTASPLRVSTDDVIEHTTAMKLISHAGVGDPQFRYDAFALPGDRFGWPSDIHVHIVRRRESREPQGSKREVKPELQQAFHVVLGIELPVLGPLNVHIDQVAGVVSVRLVTHDRERLAHRVETASDAFAKTLKEELAHVGLRLGAIRVEQYEWVDARRIDPHRLLPTSWEAFA